MSQSLLIKSNQYLNSAQFLIENEFWCPSVHCSYYACLQLIKQILYLKKGRKTVDSDLRNKYSHVYLIDNIVALYAGTVYHKPELKFFNFLEIDLNTDLYDLKAKRRTADYDADNISEKDCKSAYTASRDIINMLDKIYLSRL